MDAALIHLWNDVVGIDDHVWHLGDFAFRNHLEYIKQLHGKIHLVLGNHDRFSQTVNDSFAEVRELYHGRLLGDKTTPLFYLFHYPLVSWPQKSYGTVHLYGHVHGRYSRAGERSLDVGVDVHNFSPILLTTAVQMAEANYEKGKAKQNSTGTCAESRPTDLQSCAYVEFAAGSGPETGQSD